MYTDSSSLLAEDDSRYSCVVRDVYTLFRGLHSLEIIHSFNISFFLSGNNKLKTNAHWRLASLIVVLFRRGLTSISYLTEIGSQVDRWCQIDTQPELDIHDSCIASVDLRGEHMSVWQPLICWRARE